MTPKILEGKTLAEKIRQDAKVKIEELKAKHGKIPFLFAVDPAFDESSTIYLKREISACHKLGIKTELKKISPKISKSDFINLLKTCSSDKNIDAILIPRPLPEHLNDISIWQHLNPNKDIDGTSVINAGKLFLCKSFDEIEKNDFFVPCTALAVIKLMRYHNITVSGKSVAVLGRSSTVGKPLAHMLSALNATVTLCHSKTEKLAEILQNSDILLSAVGKPKFIDENLVKSDAIIIDIGTNTDEKGNFCGDVDFESVIKKASAITPVPGGVGPVTLSCLLKHIAKSAFKSV